jgi:hypothetical protein
VWFNPDLTTNVLSFAVMAEKFRITYDNQVEDVFKIHTPKGIIPFRQVSKNLYVYVPNQKVEEIAGVHEVVTTRVYDDHRSAIAPILLPLGHKQEIKSSTEIKLMNRQYCPTDQMMDKSSFVEFWQEMNLFMQAFIK